jgi:hypothetical protein
MLYKITFRKETKIVEPEYSQDEKVPRVLAYEKPVRFGRSRLQRRMSYEIMRPMETTTRTQGSFIEPREVTPLM